MGKEHAAKKKKGGGENSQRWPQLQYRSMHEQEGFELGEGHAVDQQQNQVPLGLLQLQTSKIWSHDLTRPALLLFILGHVV